MPHSWVTRSDMGEVTGTRATREDPAPRSGAGYGGVGGRRRQSPLISASLPPRSTAFSKSDEFRPKLKHRGEDGGSKAERPRGAISPRRHGGAEDGSNLETGDSWLRRDMFRKRHQSGPRNPRKTRKAEPAHIHSPIVGRVRGKQPRLNQESLPSLRHPHVVAAIELVGREEAQNAHRKRLNRKAGKFGKTSAAFRHYARYL